MVNHSSLFIAALIDLTLYSLHQIELAYKTLDDSMHELLHSRRENLETHSMGSSRDVFSVMIRTTQSGEDRLAMSDDELVRVTV